MKSEDFLSEKYELQIKKMRELSAKNQQLSKENSCLVESLKVFENKLDEERQKRIALKQYVRTEMVKRNGIKVFEGKDCQQIIYKVCQLANGLIT